MSIEKDIRSKGFLSIQEKTYVNITFTGLFFYNKSDVFFKRFKLTEPQYNVLRILRGQAGRKISPTDIQSRMLQKNSNVTRLLQKLVKKKLILYNRKKKDKRSYECSLSKKGISLLDKIDNELKMHSRETIRLDVKKMKQLNSLLDELRNNLFAFELDESSKT